MDNVTLPIKDVNHQVYYINITDIRRVYRSYDRETLKVFTVIKLKFPGDCHAVTEIYMHASISMIKAFKSLSRKSKIHTLSR